MNCNNVKLLLDEYLDNTLILPDRAEVDAHLANCAACQVELEARQGMLSKLRELPVPPMRYGFQRRAFKQARRAHRRGWSGFYLGFSSAVAAGLLIWLGISLWQIQVPLSDVQMPTVVLQVQQPSEVRLVFNANEDLQPVDFTLQLPSGVVLEGYPPLQEINWQDRLTKGRNVLNLVLIASERIDSEVVAVITHQGKQRRFHIPLMADGNRSGSRLLLGKVFNFS